MMRYMYPAHHEDDQDSGPSVCLSIDGQLPGLFGGVPPGPLGQEDPDPSPQRAQGPGAFCAPPDLLAFKGSRVQSGSRALGCRV